MRKYDAVISDIDGCLGPETTEPMDTARVVELLKWNRAAIETGDRPVLTVCSGRPQPYAEAICRMIGNNEIPCVCENGVWVYDPKDNRFLMDPAIKPEHLDAARAAMRWADQELEPKGIIYQPGKSASMSLWHRDTPFLMAQVPMIRERFAKEGWPLRVSNTVAWVNCDLAFVSKATGIARLAAERGLKKERLLGIGDTMGDMAIREMVGFFACPANADPQLKKVADYVSSKEEVEGVLDVLGRIKPS